jgi:hypothetical protein
MVLLIAILSICSIIAGCSESASDGKIQPAPTTPASGVSLVPGPTQTMPQGREVTVQVNRDPLDPTITVIFSGGAGMFQVSELNIRVTRSDGQVRTDKMIKPGMQEERRIEGTKGKDRVEVSVSLVSGETFKIYDRIVEFGTHP